MARALSCIARCRGHQGQRRDPAHFFAFAEPQPSYASMSLHRPRPGCAPKSQKKKKSKSSIFRGFAQLCDKEHDCIFAVGLGSSFSTSSLSAVVQYLPT